MNDVEFLRLHQRRLARRVGRRSRAMNREIERVVSPWMRKNPKTGLAAGAVAGLLVGAAMTPPRGGRRRGWIDGPVVFLKGTAAYALRSKLFESLTEPETED